MTYWHPSRPQHRVKWSGIDEARFVYLHCTCGFVTIKEAAPGQCLTLLVHSAQSEFLDHQRSVLP